MRPWKMINRATNGGKGQQGMVRAGLFQGRAGIWDAKTEREPVIKNQDISKIAIKTSRLGLTSQVRELCAGTGSHTQKGFLVG